MAKASSKGSSNKARQLEPFDKRSINLAKFKPDLTAKDFKALFPPVGGIITFPFFPIETLTCTKTIGLGRTNLTIIVPTIVQIDQATPRASFDRRATPSRNPIIQMHFEPSAYGITSVATYIMEFTIQAFGQSTFNPDRLRRSRHDLEWWNEGPERPSESVIGHAERAAFTADLWISGADSGRRMGVVLHPSPLPPDSDIAIKLGRRGVG
jgi:hypothetical protein